MRAWWFELEPRQRGVICGGGLILLLLAVYHLAIEPVLSEKAKLKREVRIKTEAAAKMTGWRDEWRALNTKGQTKTTGDSLFATLDRIAGQVGLKNKVAYMKPTSPANRPGQPKIERVDMKLQDISTKDLVAFLLRAETDAGVGIRRMAVVREGSGPFRIQAVAVFESVESGAPRRGKP